MAASFEALLLLLFMFGFLHDQRSMAAAQAPYRLHSPSEVRRQIHDFMRVAFPGSDIPVPTDDSLAQPSLNLTILSVNVNPCWEKAGLYVNPAMVIPVHETRWCVNPGETRTHTQQVANLGANTECVTMKKTITVARAVWKGSSVQIENSPLPLAAGCSLMMR